jgi:endonuclease/exonuclease/phosphatase family metal-dependent hydrolase
MTDTIKIATFNAENLFARYNFKEGPSASLVDSFTLEVLNFTDIDKSGKTALTAALIRDEDADIVCLQEIDSLTTLDNFNLRHLAGLSYDHRVLLDGNDSRGIDVALLSRYPVKAIQSHREDRLAPLGLERIFSRDCLRVDLDISGQPMTIYINHFKSMTEGREFTRPKRIEQVGRVIAILEEDWGGKLASANVVVLGDFNDFVETPGDVNSAIESLVTHNSLVNTVDWIVDKDQRYTHRFLDRGKRRPERRQLDYILLSKLLADRVPEASRPHAVNISRKGMSWWNEFYSGCRLDGVGFDMPVASDHALVSVTLPKF